jgi:hypothetical protein
MDFVLQQVALDRLIGCKRFAQFFDRPDAIERARCAGF